MKTATPQFLHPPSRRRPWWSLVVSLLVVAFNGVAIVGLRQVHGPVAVQLFLCLLGANVTLCLALLIWEWRSEALIAAGWAACLFCALLPYLRCSANLYRA